MSVPFFHLTQFYPSEKNVNAFLKALKQKFSEKTRKHKTDKLNMEVKTFDEDIILQSSDITMTRRGTPTLAGEFFMR